MMLTNDILKRSKEIKLWIAAGDISKAMKRLLDFVMEFSTLEENTGEWDPFSENEFSRYENEAVLLSSRYNRIEKSAMLGIQVSDSAEVEKNKIIMALLQTLDELTKKLRTKIAELPGL